MTKDPPTSAILVRTKYCRLIAVLGNFLYNGMKNGGNSVREHGGKAALKTHLCGLKIKTPPTFTTSIVVNPLPEISLRRPGFNRVRDEDRFWLKNPYDARIIDYIFNVEDAPSEDHVLLSPDSDQAESSSDEENKSNIDDEEDERSEGESDNGNSSHSTTPKFSARPVVFGRTFAVNQKTVKLTEVQIVFICQGCRTRLATLGDCHATGPFTDDDWHSEDVVWYPARFRKHHPHARDPKNEFEFVYLDCVNWTPDNYTLFRPSRHCKHDRTSCEAILNSEPKFFTELAMPGGGDKDRIRAWAPHWWRKTRKFSALLK
ncbi:hypothetical protein B0H16DRAFT_1448424 [Mycena metata]|uniref:Uncharacterized protein n=1 Tax=Mycena metata TaxID=1033252 RepID=A0AAD7K7U6_9AGAR|nr:hypothetical protein B0H16DRAFT_1448424 [Mycena metata]